MILLNYPEIIKYVGNWENSNSIGEGTVFYQDGLTYKGTFYGLNKKKGHGILTD